MRLSKLLNKTYVCTCKNLRSLALDWRLTFPNRIKSYIKNNRRTCINNHNSEPSTNNPILCGACADLIVRGRPCRSGGGAVSGIATATITRRGSCGQRRYQTRQRVSITTHPIVESVV